MLLVTCILKYSIIIQLLFERKYSSGRVVAKLAWIKVLVGEIRIGPVVGQRFGSLRVKPILGRREFWLQVSTGEIILQVMKTGLEQVALYIGVMYSIDSSVSARNYDDQL